MAVLYCSLVRGAADGMSAGLVYCHALKLPDLHPEGLLERPNPMLLLAMRMRRWHLEFLDGARRGA
jgi:hypothetical protein